MECAGKEYGDCTSWGVKEVVVLFLYRDKYGTHLPDETVKVCMCSAHCNVLKKIHEGKPLTMRGERAEWAIHESLFAPFSHKNATFTYVKITVPSKDGSGEQHYNYCVVNGRNIEKFRRLMFENDPEIGYISEVAIFLMHFNGALLEFEVAEMKYVTSEYDIDVLKNLPTYYAPVSDYILVKKNG